LELTIRAERLSDIAAIHAVEAAAFGTDAEATLVDALRASGDDFISLVATRGDEAVGHICFSRVTIEGAPSQRRFSALAPLAVLPAHQRQGIGAMLVTAGLDECRQRSIDAVFVVGSPAYYSRFGFAPAGDSGVTCEFDVPRDVFQVVELRPGTLSAGRLKYPAAFHGV
jgi:putative acetyltransferase